MIVQQEVQITIKVVLEIDTDQVEYGVHGGCEYPDEIANQAVRYYTEQTELMPGELASGIKQIGSNVEWYAQGERTKI